MDGTERAEFVRNYMRLLGAVWADEAVGRKLRADPKATLAEYLIAVPDGAAVTVVGSEVDPDVDEQVRLWEQGAESGTYTLTVPDAPLLETRELTEEELESVAAGWGADG